MTSPTQRTQPRQVAERVTHDFYAAAAILDEALVAHVGFAVDGEMFVLPMAYARVGDQLLLHGAVASRIMRSLAGGIDVCVTVTLLDGMVLAKSTFNHSMNYRSVMVFGTAQAIEDPQEKAAALAHLVEFLVPGRSREARAADDKELNATTLLSLPLGEFSVKQRSGPPEDAAKDESLDVWTGEIPLRQVASAPLAAPDVAAGHDTPEYLQRLAPDYHLRNRHHRDCFS